MGLFSTMVSPYKKVSRGIRSIHNRRASKRYRDYAMQRDLDTASYRAEIRAYHSKRKRK